MITVQFIVIALGIEDKPLTRFALVAVPPDGSVLTIEDTNYQVIDQRWQVEKADSYGRGSIDGTLFVVVRVQRQTP